MLRCEIKALYLIVELMLPGHQATLPPACSGQVPSPLKKMTGDTSLVLALHGAWFKVLYMHHPI